MYIEPNTNIILLKNAPITNNYKDTLWFDSKADQENYFKSLTAFDLKNYTYQRVNLGVTRVGINAEKLYNCNYMMFQNASFGKKWFYAFITKVEYVNNDMSHVFFELDVMQTWLFDHILKQCYVEREHSATDVVGDNVVAENVDIGFYVDETAETTDLFDSYVALLAYGNSADGSQYQGGYFGGLFSGINYLGVLLDDEDGINNLKSLLKSFQDTGTMDEIVSLTMIPFSFYTTDETPEMRRFDAKMEQEKLGSYVPKNKKLLTYPYNCLYVTDNSGNYNSYRYEMFQSREQCGFILSASMSPNMEILLYPIAYNNQQFNYDEMLSMTNFPQCALTSDTYKAWLAQNYVQSFINVSGSIATGAAGFASGDLGSTLAGVVGVTTTLNNMAKASMLPNSIKGSQGNSTQVGERIKNFYFINRHISEEYAECVDDYFSMYGYATHKVKIPNRNVRPHYTYTKTTDCTIVGEIPADDISKICSLYNKGITFWKNGANVGNYSLDNRPT